MNNQEVLRVERDGVEYFTVVATGESAVSERGLSRMSGVPKTTVIRWFSDLTHEGIPKWLKPLDDMPLTLTHEIKKDGKTIKPIPAETASDFLFLVAENLHKKEAFATLKQISRIGLTSYIQSQTGWLPEEFTAAPEAHKNLNEFLSLAREWDRGVMLVVDWEGYQVDMSDSWTFLDEIVFSGFTIEEYVKFEDENRELNLKSIERSEQVQLFFERNPEIVERQQPYIDQVQEMLSRVRNPQAFFSEFVEAFGTVPQDSYFQLIQDVIDYRIAQRKAAAVGSN